MKLDRVAHHSRLQIVNALARVAEEHETAFLGSDYGGWHIVDPLLDEDSVVLPN